MTHEKTGHSRLILMAVQPAQREASCHGIWVRAGACHATAPVDQNVKGSTSMLSQCLLHHTKLTKVQMKCVVTYRN